MAGSRAGRVVGPRADARPRIDRRLGRIELIVEVVGRPYRRARGHQYRSRPGERQREAVLPPAAGRPLLAASTREHPAESVLLAMRPNAQRHQQDLKGRTLRPGQKDRNVTLPARPSRRALPDSHLRPFLSKRRGRRYIPKIVNLNFYDGNFLSSIGLSAHALPKRHSILAQPERGCGSAPTPKPLDEAARTIGCPASFARLRSCRAQVVGPGR